MKRLLLLPLVAGVTALSSNAKTEVYYFDEGVDGTVFGVSNNGKYVVGGDDADNIGFFWLSDDPETLTTVKNCVIRDAANDGTMVGTFYNNGSYTAIAGYYDGEEWHQLPLSDDLIGESFAMSISPDAKYIGGYQFTYYADSYTGGRYYPCLWTKDEYGDYQLTMYNNIELPDHQGFAVGAMSDDGRVLAGQVFCGFASRIPALLVDGEFVIFNTIEEKVEPWYYKGEVWGYDTNTYIDGFKDYTTDDNFYGTFLSIDNKGNYYGTRTRATEVQEDGSGTLVYGGFKYNYESETWEDQEGGSRGEVYYCGFDGNYISTSNGGLIVDGEKTTLRKYFGLERFTRQIAGLVGYSEDGTVAGGTSLYLVEATGEYAGQPFFLKMDPLAGVNDIVTDNNNSNVNINVVGEQIVVTGAQNVAVYNTTGQLVSTKTVSTPGQGIYIVKADNRTAKVAVK